MEYTNEERRSDKTNENVPYHDFIPTSAIEHVIKAVKISIKENPSNMTLYSLQSRPGL